jgi:hypothetical protein
MRGGPLAREARAPQSHRVIARGLVRSAVVVGSIAWLAPAMGDGRAPCVSAPECLPGICDPLCVEVGRYRVTEEVVDDTGIDHRLWQRRAVVSLPWDEAVLYCQHLTLDGLGGWRLPSPAELANIRYKPGGLFGGMGHRHYCVPSIDQAAFPETPADPFWTSRRMADDTAWYVDFADGRSHRDTRSEGHWVRCTHDPL